MNATLEKDTQHKTHSETHQAILQNIATQQRRLGLSSDFLNNPTSFELNNNDITINNKSLNNDNHAIIAYKNFLSKLFRVVHKKRSKIMPIIVSQLFYLQQNTNENYSYIDEEMNNFLQIDPANRTYDYGFITGHKLQDIADVCDCNKSVVSRNISYLEECGYLTKRAVADSTTDAKYKSDERIHIRLNLVNLFKDLIRHGIDNLDEKSHLLHDEYKELYTYIKHVIIHIDNIELTKKQAVDVEPNKIDVWHLVECYARAKGETLNSPVKHSKIRYNLEQIHTLYSSTDLMLAMDNYELFRYIANRHERYMLTVSNFFTLENIKNFVECNFTDYLITQDLLEPSENKLKAGFKTVGSASQMVLKRKIHETNAEQILLDNCVHKLRTAKSTTSVLDTEVEPANQANIVEQVEPSVKEFVDNFFNTDTAQKGLKKYYRNSHYQETHDLEDVIGEAYVFALELQSKHRFDSNEILLNHILFALRKHLDKSKDGAISVDDVIIENTVTTATNDNMQVIFDTWNVEHIFDLDHSNKKTLYQILFCLATNDKTTIHFAKEYKGILNKYFFDFHNDHNTKITNILEFMEYAKSRPSTATDLLKNILKGINEYITDYLRIKKKSLQELVLESDLLADSDVCSVYIDIDQIEMSMSDVTDNVDIVNASQIVDIPALHNVDSELYNILTHISYKMNSSTVSKWVAKRFE